MEEGTSAADGHCKTRDSSQWRWDFGVDKVVYDESIQIPHRKNRSGTTSTLCMQHAGSLGTYPTKLGLHLMWTSRLNGVSD